MIWEYVEPEIPIIIFATCCKSKLQKKNNIYQYG